MKEFADNNLRFDENGSKMVEKTVGKGEIACAEQFSPFPSVFKRLVLQTRKNQGLFGKPITTQWVKMSIQALLDVWL